MAKKLCLEVSTSVERIMELTGLNIFSHRVDGEVSTHEVIRQGYVTTEVGFKTRVPSTSLPFCSSKSPLITRFRVQKYWERFANVLKATLEKLSVISANNKVVLIVVGNAHQLIANCASDKKYLHVDLLN
jgi:hypothetical protein